jgi:hypothetical protein
MAISLASLSKEKVIRAPRIIVLGVEKIGKTTFACGSRFEKGVLVETGLNAPVVLSVKGEEGADSLDVPKFPTAEDYDGIVESIKALYEEEHDHQSLVLDSASAMEPLIWAEVCKAAKCTSIEEVGGGYGKGYTEAVGRWRQILEYLDMLRSEKGMSSIIIGHVKVKRFDDPAGPSYDTYTFDIHEKAANLLFRWADLILFCGQKTIVKTEDKGFNKVQGRGLAAEGAPRFLFTQKRPAHPGGGRGAFGQLPYELPLDWKAFEDAVAAVTQ